MLNTVKLCIVWIILFPILTRRPMYIFTGVFSENFYIFTGVKKNVDTKL
jgi:hypothetical protein